jgi:hypothetical protein
MVNLYKSVSRREKMPSGNGGVASWPILLVDWIPPILSRCQLKKQDPKVWSQGLWRGTEEINQRAGEAEVFKLVFKVDASNRLSAGKIPI